MADIIGNIAGNVVENISGILISTIIGILLILIWLPTIIWNEINGKINHDQERNLETSLQKDKKKLIQGILSGSNLSVNFNEITNTNITKPVDSSIFKDYIYIYQDLKILTTNDTSNTDGSYNVNNVAMKDSIIKSISSNISFKPDSNSIDSTKIKDDAYLKPIALKILTNTYDFTPIVSGNNTTTFTYFYNYYGVLNNTIVTDMSPVLNLNKEDSININKYENGTIDQAVISVINRKNTNYLMQLWIIRIVTVVMLCSGLILLVSPIRAVVSGSAGILGSIPVINLVVPLFRLIGGVILGLYDTLSFFGSIILTAVLTLIVYCMVNYTLVSSLILGLIVGLLIFLNKK